MSDLTAPPAAAPRTSILAVLSLVSGVAGLILCCIPVIGLLGVVFGVPALFSISASGGARRGTGMAVTGVLLGLIGAAFGAAVYLGAARGAAFFIQYAAVMPHIEAQDLDQTRAHFVPRVQPEITAERIAEFRAAYHAEVGAYQGPPDSLLEFALLYFQLDQNVLNAMGGLGTIYSNALPVATEFDGGATLVVAAASPTSASRELLNVGVMQDSGAVIWLLPPPASPTTTPPADPAPAPAPDSSPSGAPDAPTPPAQPDPESGPGEGPG